MEFVPDFAAQPRVHFPTTAEPTTAQKRHTLNMASKVFIVTGASQGLGLAIAKYLIGESHQVVVTARSAEPLEDLKRAHPGQVDYVAGDMTDAELPEKVISTALSAFGRLDGLVLNHAMLVSEKFESMSIAQCKGLYDVNVFSCIAMAQRAIPEIRKTKGCIMWVSSGAARNAYQGWSAYASSKAAVNTLSTCLAFEEKDITSVTIEPGRVDTDMQKHIRSFGKDSMDKSQHDNFIQAFEQGQLLKPEQPGHVIARFVAEPDKTLSGQNLKWNSPELKSYQG
ncbi:hypothetical protein E4U56_004089 [Claviceps arundinis]|uniref:Uncharacterized protein n=1 Tax=Claviceps arundinis TaxID=1623583 RepID=A0A9P7MP04_9HYPO|nr:hypothetical protein E4U56_004089 [Claviceps arundinis]